jgi:hypothetical protein
MINQSSAEVHVKNFVNLALALSIFLGVHAYGHGSQEKADCEKKDKAGKVSDVDAKDKDTCKQKGGTWVEPKSEEGHAHEGEHKHEH